MIDKCALRAAIMAKGMTQTGVAEKLGVSRKTFYDRMTKGVFDSDEIMVMIKLLDISDPMAIFFKTNVTQQVTSIHARLDPTSPAGQEG